MLGGQPGGRHIGDARRITSVVSFDIVCILVVAWFLSVVIGSSETVGRTECFVVDGRTRVQFLAELFFALKRTTIGW